jgi:hypothetical protein
MTTTKSMLNILAVFAVFAAGCSTTRHTASGNTENMLSASGFKAMPATTPQREEHLRSLPTDTLTVANLNGHNYFLFPDPAENVLFVGQQTQFQQYQKMRLDNQMALAQVNTIPVNDDWTLWGAWGRRW